MFQPGEEGHHGARVMLDDGIIDPLPDAAFALHIMPNAPHGIFAGRAGPLLASSDVLSITVTGAGGHASTPHDASDPITVDCAIVTERSEGSRVGNECVSTCKSRWSASRLKKTKTTTQR